MWAQTGSGGNGWSVTGNAGTNATTNFIGTTDNNPVRFRMSNVYAGEVDLVSTKTFVGYGAGQNNTTRKYNAILDTKLVKAVQQQAIIEKQQKQIDDLTLLVSTLVKK